MQEPRVAPAPLASALMVLAAGGCALDAPFDGGAIRTDSSDVVLITYPGLPPIENSRIAIATEPEMVLGEGGAFVGPDHEFFDIRGVSQLLDGTLVVANRGTTELRFYGVGGDFLRAVGREGDGPGDFRDLQGPYVIQGDTIVVWDDRAMRFQHFGSDGAFVRATSTLGNPFMEFSGGPRTVRTVLGDGRAVLFLGSTYRSSTAVERLPSLVATHHIGDGGWDSVRVIAGRENMNGGYVLGAEPMAHGAGATMVVADGAQFRVEVFDPDGALVSIISAAVPEVSVTAQVIDAWIEHQIANAPGWAAQGDGRAEYESRLRAIAPANQAPFLPAIRAIFVDAEERIWVERYDVPARGPSRWEVFERDGTWIGRVEMPEGFARGRSPGPRFAPQFSIVSGRLAGVWVDPDTGVETVRVYRVLEPVS